MLRRFVLIAALILCFGSKSAQAQLQNDLLIPSKWTVAVLFRVEPNKRTYIGTVQQPNLSLPLPLPIDPRIPSRFLSPKGTYDYEVWLACSGSTLGLAYHSKNGQFAHIYSSHPSSITGWRRDTNKNLRTLVAQAKPADALPPPKNPSKGITDRGGAPVSLLDLVKRSPIICVGRVVGLLSNLHTPQNASQDQASVFLIAPENTLVTSEALPAIVKVSQIGGYLSSHDTEGRWLGEGHIDIEDPLLQVGQRYIFFLARPLSLSIRLKDKARGYFISSDGSITGKRAELDEFRKSDMMMGKLWIKPDGTIAVPEQQPEWKFQSGPQILGMSEEEAISLIQYTLKP